MKTISIRLNDSEEKILEMYKIELKKTFEGLKVDTSAVFKRALFYAANNDPCANGKIAEYEKQKLLKEIDSTRKHICEQKIRKKHTI